MQNFVSIYSLTNVVVAIMMLAPAFVAAQQPSEEFRWPAGKKAALSLSFHDARPSQVLSGTAFLDRHNVKVTFFVVPETVEQQLQAWKDARANGHEIGNHTLTHPCSGNRGMRRGD